MHTVGLDLGRRNVKLFTGDRYVWFPAVVGEWRDLKLRNNFGSKAFDCMYGGERFFAGVLAENESEFARQMLIEDKAHQDTLLLALIALSHSPHDDFDIVTGLPVNLHDEEHKNALSNLLVGTHTITVNGVTRTLTIHRVRVVVEGGGAFWSSPKDGVVRLIDGGSKTINYITMRNRKYVDRDSGTLGFGFDTNKSTDASQLASRVVGEVGKKWGKQDKVYTVGGEASRLASLVKPFFPNTATLQPEQSAISTDGSIDFNMFANAMGYYNIGRTLA